MSGLMVLTMVTLLVLTAVIFLRGVVSRRYDLLSWRNLFLVGFAHFVLLSGYFTVAQGIGALKPGVVTDRAIGLYAALSVLFLFTFLAAVHLTFRRGWFQRIVPRLELPATTAGVLIAIAVLMGLALVFTLVPLPVYLALLGAQFRSGMATVAVGLAMFWALANRFNPAAWAVLLGCAGLAFTMSVVGGTGRRDAVAVLFAIPWVWYYMSLRYRSSARMLGVVGGLAVAGTVAIAAYSMVRYEGFRGEEGPGLADRAAQITQLASKPLAVSKDVTQSMLYTDTAGNTMFILNTYGTAYEYRPFAGLWWMIVNPVPRSLYPGKPEALGIIIRKQMDVGPNLGAGVLGQAWHEGGFFPVAMYALVLGLIYGTMDRAMRDRAWNPYFVAWGGAATGNVLAMPRGDVALFLIQVLAAMISSAVALWFIRVAFGRTAAAFPPLSVRLPEAAQGWEEIDQHEQSENDEDLYDPALAAAYTADHGYDARH